MTDTPNPSTGSSSSASSGASVGGDTLSWSSHAGFLMACIGAAVGLGNIWKFPYMAGTQGGGAFVMIYLLTIFLIAIPVAAAELVTGRAGRQNAVGAVRHMAENGNRPNIFAPVGIIGIAGSYLLLTFYAVIAGWVMAYVARSASGMLAGKNSVEINMVFDDLLANPVEMITWQVLFLALTGLVISREIRKGLERANLILMPLLFVMLLVVCIYGVVAGDMGQAMAFLFTPDFSQITPEVILSAVGHGFFSVGVGAAMLITYGAYLDKHISIGEAAIVIGLADTLIALLAGLGIFAIVFGQSLDPAAGPGLIFTTLPLAFTTMPGGSILATLFFLLVLFAALTSALALTEVPVRWVNETFNISRSRATNLVLVSIFVIGLASVFSFNALADFRLTSEGVFADKTLFDVKDYIASNILLPLGGLLIVTFAAWVAPADYTARHFGGPAWLHTSWLWLARIVAPTGIVWVFIENL